MPKAPKHPAFPPNTELVALEFTLHTEQALSLPANYPKNLHAWFLRTIEQVNPTLSAFLHDSQTEKAFTLSPLFGSLESTRGQLIAPKGTIYHWSLSALYRPLCQWLGLWLQQAPRQIDLHVGSLSIDRVSVSAPPTTYEALWAAPLPQRRNFCLSFLSPTGFRHKGHHLPLPIPESVFQSYLRRWNVFSERKYDPADFLAWVDEMVFVSDYELICTKTTASKQGTVTGFTGNVEFGVTGHAQDNPEYYRLLHALVQFAPYCGTGHKTTFGLGQTRLGSARPTPPPQAITQLSDRIATLTDCFLALKKRKGSKRAIESAELWATILARRELGESLQAIAIDLEMPYDTVKTYIKLARRALATTNSLPQ